MDRSKIILHNKLIYTKIDQRHIAGYKEFTKATGRVYSGECKLCQKPLTGKQTKFCSIECARDFLKRRESAYAQRQIEKRLDRRN